MHDLFVVPDAHVDSGSDSQQDHEQGHDAAAHAMYMKKVASAFHLNRTFQPNVRFRPIADVRIRVQIRMMRIQLAIYSALLLGACSQPREDERMFVRMGDPEVAGDPSHLFLEDAFKRLGADERRLYQSDNAAGFVFEGQKSICIVLVTLRTDVLLDGPDPVFCYDKNTYDFVERF